MDSPGVIDSDYIYLPNAYTSEKERRMSGGLCGLLGAASSRICFPLHLFLGRFPSPPQAALQLGLP